MKYECSEEEALEGRSTKCSGPEGREMFTLLLICCHRFKGETMAWQVSQLILDPRIQLGSHTHTHTRTHTHTHAALLIDYFIGFSLNWVALTWVNYKKDCKLNDARFSYPLKLSTSSGSSPSSQQSWRSISDLFIRKKSTNTNNNSNDFYK